MTPVIRAQELTKVYRRGAEEVRALDGVSFEIQAGEFVAVVGPSGSGKTTLLNLLGCLDVPTSGTLSLEGQETRGLLAAAINSLSEREKIVVTLYYFEGLTLNEIGEILGVTESRVCQIHTKAVGQLRLQLVETE